MAQWIYVLRVTRFEMLTGSSTPEEDDILSRHFSNLKDLTEKGVMVLVGRTQTADKDTFGIAIFEAEDETSARVIMENDPAVKNGVMKATLYPYRIALLRD